VFRLRPHVNLNGIVNISQGIEEVGNKIIEIIVKEKFKYISLEMYPGVQPTALIEYLQALIPEALIVNTDDLFISPKYISQQIQDDLTTDEVFGRFSHKKFEDFLDKRKIEEFKKMIMGVDRPVIVYGVCASEIIKHDILIYLDITRLEIQERFRENYKNWKGYNENDFNEKLKRAYYFEWPAGKEVKDRVLPILDYYIDMKISNNPKMITGDDFIEVLGEFISQPFRLVPFFQPGVWGGQWMKENFNVGKEEDNLAWCFDGVPEENSIIAKSNQREIEMPAENLLITHPEELLGRKVYGQYGKDFPIRFNYLDTMGGGNLSLQVHPTLDYAYRNFGAKYTQDESYYIMDSKEGAKVYLGVKDNINKNELINALEEAQNTGVFDEEKYINILSVNKHDHLLIPGGTIHSSGKDCVVLEISSTPNRFTFKLWDWGRLDLDGKPRPISIHHGKHVIKTEFNTSFVAEELYNNENVITKENKYTEVQTGLHELEPIETRVLTLSKPIHQSTMNSVNVLKIVEGESAQVVSIDGSFNPTDIYYGETFIIPERIKNYILKPINGFKEVKIIKAFIR